MALETDRLMEQGLSEPDARAAARRAFGNVMRAEERFYAASRWMWWENLAADLRYAIRSLLKAPGFTAAVLAALALGIGANTAIFSVVNTVLLHPLPYPDSSRMVTITRHAFGNSMPMFAYWEQNNPGFVDLTGYQTGINANLTGGSRPELVEAVKASQNYFRLFGANPIRGRTFTAEEDRPGGPLAAVISYNLWAQRFGSDPVILGKTIAVGGASYPVIGILSPNFKPSPRADLWIPLQADPNSQNQAHVVTVSARLPSGTTLAQANSWMAVLGKRYVQAHPEQLGRDDELQVSFLQERITGGVRPALLILLGAVGLVLLIACANVANLLLARATSRQREIAVRAAIGAGRGRLLQQLLTESLLLALAGGTLGLLLGSWGVRALLSLAPGDLPRVQEMASIPALDPGVAGFTVGLAVVTGILFGVFPAVRLSRPDLASSFQESNARAGTSFKHGRTRSVLVAAEVGISVVLLCGAMLLIRSFAAMHTVSLGFDPSNLLTMQISLVGPGYSNPKKVDLLARNFAERAERIPGVESAALANSLPLWGHQDMIFDIPGRLPLKDFKFTADVQWRFVSAHYFDVLRIPLLSGRLLQQDEPSSTVVINQAMARKYWPNGNPVGQSIYLGPGLGPGFEEGVTQIVGVVGDVRERLDDDPPSTMYQTPAQIPDAAMALVNGLQPSAIMVRTRPGVSPMGVSKAVEQVLLTEAELPVSDVRTMDRAGLDSTARQNFNLLLLGLFAAIALLLAAVGIYGVMSYSVEQRTHEIGIRAALGASSRDTLRLVLRQALRMSVAGIAVGIVASFGLTRLLKAQLFGVQPLDPMTFVTVPIILLLIALAAAGVPALRASRVDPMVALRHE
jgi:putative ABC transport system permease protein